MMVYKVLPGLVRINLSSIIFKIHYRDLREEALYGNFLNIQATVIYREAIYWCTSSST